MPEAEHGHPAATMHSRLTWCANLVRYVAGQANAGQFHEWCATALSPCCAIASIRRPAWLPASQLTHAAHGRVPRRDCQGIATGTGQALREVFREPNTCTCAKQIAPMHVISTRRLRAAPLPSPSRVGGAAVPPRQRNGRQCCARVPRRFQRPIPIPSWACGRAVRHEQGTVWR